MLSETEMTMLVGGKVEDQIVPPGDKSNKCNKCEKCNHCS